MPTWLDEALTVSLQLGQWQQLGLAFLLGSFAVATWSDLKHLSAQREFLEIWLLFVLAMLALDVYQARSGGPWQAAALKWGLIVVLSALSLKRVGVLFRLARADVAALAAAAGLLPPLLVLVFYFTAKGLSVVLGPVLRRGRPYYPFMPVVSLATLAVLALGLTLNSSVNPVNPVRVTVFRLHLYRGLITFVP